MNTYEICFSEKVSYSTKIQANSKEEAIKQFHLEIQDNVFEEGSEFIEIYNIEEVEEK